jgi:hypothetical protein
MRSFEVFPRLDSPPVCSTRIPIPEAFAAFSRALVRSISLSMSRPAAPSPLALAPTTKTSDFIPPRSAGCAVGL